MSNVGSQPHALSQRNARENTEYPDYARSARTKYLFKAVNMAVRKNYTSPCPELEERIYYVLKKEGVPLFYSDFRSGTVFDKLDLKFFAKPRVVLFTIMLLIKKGKIVAYYDDGKRDYKKLVFIVDTEWKKLLSDSVRYALWRCYDLDKATENPLYSLYEHTHQTPNDTGAYRIEHDPLEQLPIALQK